MRRKTKLDRIDADEIRQTIDSPGWQLISQRVGRAVGLEVERLLQSLDPVQTAEVRGKIQGLKLALDVPRILQEEAAKRGGKETTDGLADEI